MTKLVLFVCILLAAAALPCQSRMLGVNLGGWMVLESWIVPSIFNNNSVAGGQGEWQFCAQLGPAQARQQLEQHWNTWLTEDDISSLATAGVTHVRIPVGYWIVNITSGEPFVSGGWPYVVRALSWCKKHNILALIDLHGAPGSQNGNDHSGRNGPIEWQEPANIDRTVNVLAQLAALIVKVNAQPETANVVFGMELLNEPKTSHAGGPILLSVLMDFYQRGYAAVRSAGFTGDIWMHDGFDYGNSAWKGFMPPPNYVNVYIDTHIYHCFGGPYASLNPWQHIEYTCKTDRQTIASHTWADWTVVGEWSMAISEATPTVGDGTTWRRTFYESQIDAYAPDNDASDGKGAFFWNFKIEHNYSFDEWNFLHGIQNDYIPQLQTLTRENQFAFTCDIFN